MTKTEFAFLVGSVAQNIKPDAAYSHNPGELRGKFEWSQAVKDFCAEKLSPWGLACAAASVASDTSDKASRLNLCIIYNAAREITEDVAGTPTPWPITDEL